MLVQSMTAPATTAKRAAEIGAQCRISTDCGAALDPEEPLVADPVEDDEMALTVPVNERLTSPGMDPA